MAGLGLLILMAGLVLSLSFISATSYYFLCLKDGETIEFSQCNPRMSDYTCDTSREGYCTQCVYIGSQGKYCPARINYCNGLGLTCSYLSGNNTLDITPPEINITYPINNEVYSNKRIEFDMKANEDSSWYYYDNLKADGKWKKICSDTKNCEKTINFGEGETNITIKAVDSSGNEGFKTIGFYIDSKLPKIKKTAPKKDEFVGSQFSVEFQEANPISLVMHYGNYGLGYKTRNVDLNDCVSIKGASDKFLCEFEQDLAEYDGQIAYYWFVLEDIAGSIAESKHVSVNVDETAPLINNKGNLANQIGKYVFFNIDITELNIDEVGYVDSFDEKSKKLCSKLKNGYCTKKVLFKSGYHELTIQAIDKAGNYDYDSFVFDVA